MIVQKAGAEAAVGDYIIVKYRRQYGGRRWRKKREGKREALNLRNCVIENRN